MFTNKDFKLSQDVAYIKKSKNIFGFINILLAEMDFMSKYQCDCGGNMKEYDANVKVCQKCKKIPNIDTLLDVLREMGVKEETLENLKKDVHYTPV